MLGYAREELLGMSVYEVDPTFPEGFWPRHWQELKQARSLSHETVHRRKDGTTIPIEVSANYVEFENTAYNFSFCSDISERKRAEDERARYRDHLEELVAERTTALEAAHRRLLQQERLATLGQLTATVSHELRNPLGTVRSSVFSIREQSGTLDAATAEMFNRAERGIVRCDRIIEELLDYTRARQAVLLAMQIDEWIGQVLDEQRLPPGISLRRRLTAAIQVPIDSEKLRRCLINLITNACQAMEDNEPPGGELTVETRVAGQRVEIRVLDTGPGMPPDHLERIFEPLYSTKGFGIGLGLPVVRQVAEAHGGGIEIQSQPDHGTTATLWLPLEAATEPRPEASDAET